MPRLFIKIYLTILASLLLLVVVVGTFWHFSSDDGRHHPAVTLVVQLATSALSPINAPGPEQTRAIDELARRFHADLALYSPQGALIASAGRPLPVPPPGSESGDWIDGRHGAAFVFDLPDGRRLVARAPRGSRPPWAMFGFHLLLAALVV